MAKIAIIHPNLGIGGAEKLILDLGKSLKNKNHSVKIFTNFYSKNHCFEESKDFEIISAFSWIPDQIFGAFKVYLAFIKILLLTLYFLLFHNNFDIVILDQIAVISIPLLKIFKNKVIFYCHFPDQFLTDRKTLIKKIYRVPIDFLEIFCAQFSNKIFVNSNFTKNILLSFPRISKIDKKDENWIKILYPCVSASLSNFQELEICDKYRFNFVSINRFDPKKLIQRAIYAFSMLKSIVDPDTFLQIHMTIMGGCDSLQPSDVKYYDELVSLAKNYKLLDDENQKITFLKNPTDETKFSILKKSTALLYTPDNEHFGIVPLEAMIMGVPVLASASGGPLETVIDGVTGFHLRHFPVDLSKSMKFLIENPEKRREMGEAAKLHCIKKFTSKSFEDTLESIVQEILTN